MRIGQRPLADFRLSLSRPIYWARGAGLLEFSPHEDFLGTHTPWPAYLIIRSIKSNPRQEARNNCLLQRTQSQETFFSFFFFLFFSAMLRRAHLAGQMVWCSLWFGMRRLPACGDPQAFYFCRKQRWRQGQHAVTHRSRIPLAPESAETAHAALVLAFSKKPASIKQTVVRRCWVASGWLALSSITFTRECTGATWNGRAVSPSAPPLCFMR